MHRLRDELPDVRYSEKSYWAAFGNGRRKVAQLNVNKGGIRLFLALDPGDVPGLRAAPSSGGWAVQFPSVFQIAAETDLPRARQLILTSLARSEAIEDGDPASQPEYSAPGELPLDTEYVEGYSHRVSVNAYERNRRARDACLQHFGRSCSVCSLSFEARYREAAVGYIEVHHVVPLARVGTQYRLNPIRDLRPVCPNCHAVIHHRDPPFTIDEVKAMLKTAARR